MKNVLPAFLLLVFSAARLCALEPVPFTEGVSVSCNANNNAVGSLTVYDESLNSAFTFCNPAKPESDIVTARLRPGKRYTLNFGAYNDPVSYTYGVSFIEPDGYAVYIDGLPSNLITQTVTGTISQNYTVELRPVGSQQPAPLSTFSGIDIGRAISWDVGLGTRQNGDYAGRLVFREQDLSTAHNPASRARLYYAMPGSYGEIEVFYEPGSSNQVLRQIAVPGGIVDLVDNGSNAYFIRFYAWSQAEGSPGNPYILTGSPWKTIYVESGGANQLKITETEGTVSRASELTLTSGDYASGVYSWTLQEGDNSSHWRTTTHTCTQGTDTRDDIAIVRTGETTGTIVAKTKYHYVNQSWGDYAVTQIIDDPDGAALTRSFVYYSTAPTGGSEAERGNFRRIKVATDPTGNWAAFRYYDDWNRRGQLKYEQRPFVDLPASAPATIDPTSATSGQVVFRDYGVDWNGRSTRLILQQVTTNSVVTAKSTFTYGDIVGFGWPRETVTQTSYRDSTNTQIDYREFFRGDAGFDLPYKPYISKPANGTQTSMASDIGAYDSATGVFSYNSSNTHRRDIVVHGSASVGQYSNNLGTQPFYPVYLSPNQSTLEATIRDKRGLPVRTEQWVYISGLGTFSLLTYTNNTFDDAGRLTASVTNTGATATYVYTNGRLTSATDAGGTETQSTFDGLGRVATSVKKGAPQIAATLTSGYNYPAQTDITTTFTYDGVGHVLQQVVSGGTLSLTTTRVFDLAGRQTSQVDPGSFTTGIAYSSGGKIVTTTLPGGATKVSEVYLDGQPKQLSGTGVVSASNTYWIDSATGRRYRQQIVGGVSAAWTNTSFDWLGRQYDEWTPGWNGSNVARLWYYNSGGQLWKTSQPGQADTLYVYDALGQLYRQGLDVNANGTLDLASDDRITESIYSVFIDGSGRATSQTIAKVYATANSATATTTSTSTTLLSGLGANVISSSSVQDIHGNVATTTVAIDRANKKATSTVDTPDSSVNAVTISYNGRTVEARDTTGLVGRTEYDALGRVGKTIDPRIGATLTTFVAGTNQVSTVVDPASITVATYSYDSAGHVSTVTDGLGKVARYAYTLRGEKYREWGDTPYPVEYGYDAVGRQTTMKTYRGSSSWNGTTWPASPGTADTTTWTYQPATGLLSSKTDAAGKATAYTYTQARQVATRTWARGVSATYNYSATTGEVLGVDYSDSTPDLSYTYDRLGNIATVADYTGTRTFNYSATNLQMQAETLGTALYGSRVLTWKHDTSTTGALGRNTGFSLGLFSNPTGENDITYGYDTFGRFTNLGATLNGAAAGTFNYGYAANSNLISAVTETGTGLLQSRTYESNRNLISQFASTLPSRNLATYAYTHDALGRRTVKVETGEMFSRYGPGLVTKYSYNARSEVTAAQTYIGTNPNVDTTAASNALQGRSYNYGYDSIGNRTTTTANGQSSTYVSNSLNQIISRTVPGYADVSGFASSNATVTVSGQSTVRQFDYFYRQNAVSNASAPVWSTFAVSATVPGGANTSENRMLYIAKSLEAFSYDFDGNVLSDGRWDYAWDAENRLIAMTTTTVAAAAGIPQQSLQFRYDYLGRRVEKKVYNGTTPTLVSHVKFAYSSANWHLLAEYDGLNGNAVIRAYSWGLDLSRTTTGAGGVGGLLAVRDTSTSATYLPSYDANGNVFAMVNQSSGALAATYEYSAFGETVRASGTSSFADKNPFRFSTKYTDSETQLLYYGYRYYNASLGRFVGRDTIQEKGGRNLYGFCGNNGVNAYDILGMDSVDYSTSTTPDWVFKIRETYSSSLNYGFMGYGSSLSAMMMQIGNAESDFAFANGKSQANAIAESRKNAQEAYDEAHPDQATASHNTVVIVNQSTGQSISIVMPGVSAEQLDQAVGSVTDTIGQYMHYGSSDQSSGMSQLPPDNAPNRTAIPNANDTLLGRVNTFIATVGGQGLDNAVNAAAPVANAALGGAAGFQNVLTLGASSTSGYDQAAVQTGRGVGVATVGAVAGLATAGAADVAIGAFSAAGTPAFYSGMSTAAAGTAAAARGGYILANTPAGQWLNNTFQPAVLSRLGPDLGGILMNGVWTGASGFYAAASALTSPTALYFGTGQGMVWINVEAPILSAGGIVVTHVP